jgi:lysophospholipase-3
MEQLIAPEVPITCIIGSDVRTPETLFYGENGFDEQPDVVYGDGDGTVNMASLLALEKLWAEEKNQPLKVITIGGISHTSILQNDSALAEITGEIYSINSHVISSVV